MKKIYLNRALVAKKKLFFLTALLCASLMGWATQYCGETITATDGASTVTITCTNPESNTYVMLIEGGENFGGFIGEGNYFNISGVGGNQVKNNTNETNRICSFDEVNHTLTVTIKSTNVPSMYTPLYLNINGEKQFTTIQNQVFEWPASCSGTPDNEKPVMGEASLDSVTGNSAVINVAATDNIGVTQYRVVDAKNSFDALFTPKNDQITVTGLAGGTNYNFTITAKDAAGNESENSASVAANTPTYYSAPQAAATAPTVPANQVKAVYSDTYDNADCNFGEWGSGTVYTQEEYGKKYVTTNLGYFGLEGFNLNCVGMEKLHFDIWIADDATIRVVPIWGGAEQGIKVNLKGQQWNSVDIALEQYTGITDWSNISQIKIDQAANLTLWINNIYFYTTVAPAEDTEAPTAFTAEKNAESYFSVKIKANATDASGAVKFTVKNDTAVVGSANAVSGEDAIITVSGLNPNTEYNLSVIASDESGNATEPFAVAAKTLAAPAPAEAPTYAEENVLALFSDIYTNLVFGIQDWWSMPAVSVGNLTADSKALCLDPTGTPAGGCFGLAFAATDITAFDALEMDVYATTANSVLDIQVIGVGTASTKFNLVADQWNHIVLDIKGNTKNNCEQVGFYNCDKLAGFCFVQNVLFVQNGGTTAIENAEVGAKAIKMFENGQLVIIKNGVKYNALGAELR